MVNSLETKKILLVFFYIFLVDFFLKKENNCKTYSYFFIIGQSECSAPYVRDRQADSDSIHAFSSKPW